MSSLVERLLREELFVEYLMNSPTTGSRLINPDGPEAANEIERLREALTDIMEASAKRQLPITDQIYRRCEVALSHTCPPTTKEK